MHENKWNLNNLDKKIIWRFCTLFLFGFGVSMMCGIFFIGLFNLRAFAVNYLPTQNNNLTKQKQNVGRIFEKIFIRCGNESARSQ